jgi:hypothetical protein
MSTRKAKKVLIVFVFVVSHGVQGRFVCSGGLFLFGGPGCLFCLGFVQILMEREQFSFVRHCSQGDASVRGCQIRLLTMIWTVAKMSNASIWWQKE